MLPATARPDKQFKETLNSAWMIDMYCTQMCKLDCASMFPVGQHLKVINTVELEQFMHFKTTRIFGWYYYASTTV